MRATSRLAALWRNLVHRRRRERDLAEEVEAYAGLLEDEKLAQGCRARRRAARRRGSWAEPSR